MSYICNDKNHWYYGKAINIDSVHYNGDVFMANYGNVSFALGRDKIVFVY